MNSAVESLPKPEFYRVTVFGSARISSGPTYEATRRLTKILSDMGMDISTGGGPGLMEAANAGAIGSESGSRSFGYCIELPECNEPPNGFIEKGFHHKTFHSRLHQFVTWSSAFIVMPGGIGTLLELFMVWQLLQVKHLNTLECPLILVGDQWGSLLDWVRSNVVELGLANPEHLDVVKLVPSVEAAVEEVPCIIKPYYETFMQKRQAMAKQ